MPRLAADPLAHFYFYFHLKLRCDRRIIQTGMTYMGGRISGQFRPPYEKPGISCDKFDSIDKRLQMIFLSSDDLG
jgi:hypothetical protein